MHSSESLNGCECVTAEVHRCMVLLLQQCDLVFVHIFYLEF